MHRYNRQTIILHIPHITTLHTNYMHMDMLHTYHINTIHKPSTHILYAQKHYTLLYTQKPHGNAPLTHIYIQHTRIVQTLLTHSTNTTTHKPLACNDKCAQFAHTTYRTHLQSSVPHLPFPPPLPCYNNHGQLAPTVHTFSFLVSLWAMPTSHSFLKICSFSPL